MRDNSGKPTRAIMPEIFVGSDKKLLGTIICVLNKLPEYSEVPEMLHISRKTNDPALRRAQALQYLASTYYLKFSHFSDVLTATFHIESKAVKKMIKAEKSLLVFDYYSQRFELSCSIFYLQKDNLMHKATLAHNRLFNPELSENIAILAFVPNWDESTSNP